MDKWLSNVNIVRVIALLLGILLWAVVHMDISKSNQPVPAPVISSADTLNVNVEKVGLDETRYHVLSIAPSSVTVKMRGKASALKRVSPANLRVYADLSGIVEGAQIVPLKVEKLRNFPDGVIDVQVEPDSITVKAEKIQKKEMPVTIALEGAPAEGLLAGTPIIAPNRVHVTLPESRMNELQSVSGTVNLQDAREQVRTQVKLSAFDAEGRELKGAIISPAVVDVEIPITSPFKTMPLQIRLVGELPEGYAISQFSQSDGQVTVYGPQSALDKMDFYSGLEIDVSGLTEEKTFHLDIPLKDQISNVVPSKVTATVTVVPSVIKQFDDIAITFSGQNNLYETKVTKPADGHLSVNLEGAPEILNKLNSSDIQAFVDVSNRPTGIYELPLIFNLPQFVRLAPNQNLTVGVEIKEKPAEAADSKTDNQTKPE
ncbi:MAG TPA: CdaR family protein [Bacilli bacterium]